MVRYLLIFCGALSLVLGIIGIFMPLLPTTPFILLTAACWAKASPRFHNWLYHHRYFGPIIQNWENNGAVPRKAKFFAIGMMALSCLFMFWQFPERWWIGAVSSIVCSCVAVWMWLRPEA